MWLELVGNRDGCVLIVSMSSLFLKESDVLVGEGGITGNGKVRVWT